jgi:hypothetical protein
MIETMITRAPSRRYDSVQQDWRSLLPEAKFAFFEVHVRELENAYLMLSVSLNEAIDLSRHGHSAKAFQAMEVSPDLCSLLVLRLDSILHSMHQHARHFGVVPNLAPLEPGNFRTDRAQRSVRFNNLVNRVLLSERSQFVYKLSTLEQIVEDIGDCFIQSAKHVEPADTPDSSSFWDVLDACHFDLNTCLRETVVLFKSFLVVLPEEQLEGLDFTIRGLCRSRPSRQFVSSIIHPGRIGAVAGK